MLRPLSQQKKYDVFYTGDPAILPLPEDATKEQHAERARRIEVALETGQWADVVAPGEQPTVFTMRPLPFDYFGELAMALGASRTDAESFRIFAIAFRIALVDVKPLPEGTTLEFVNHPTYGRIATTSFIDKAGLGGQVGVNVVVELGQLAMERAKGVSPKS